MTQYDESSLQSALEEVKAGVSQRKAAARWGIPRATLFNRLHGSTTRAAIAETQQRLSKQQERHLTGWILTQDSLGIPPTHRQIQELATRVLIHNGDLEPLGKHWIDGFIRRNPEIKTLRGKRIDFLRVNGATTDRVKAFFALKEIPEVRAISPQHRYNMDEAGIMEGLGDNGLVLGSSRKSFALRRQPGSRTWTSVLECINALGIALPPLIIFKGKSVQRQWFPQELKAYEDWFFTASEKGWTDDSIALAWLREIFIPLTKPATKTKRLLILDGHGSHETDEFMWEFYKNDIYLLFLPSHSSHVLQPLDLSIFSPLKGAYRRELSKMQIQSDSSPIGKITFLNCYVKAREATMTKSNIKSGWNATGLWPVNVTKPLMSPYVARPLIGPLRQPSTPPATPQKAGIKRKEREYQGLSTPRGSHQVRGMIRDFLDDQKIDPVMRQLFRKICKGLDEQNTKISINTMKIKDLEAQNKLLRPQKKAKVKEDPNKRFIRIPQIIESKERLTQGLDPNGTAIAVENYIFEELCFQWQLE